MIAISKSKSIKKDKFTAKNKNQAKKTINNLTTNMKADRYSFRKYEFLVPDKEIHRSFHNLKMI